MPPASKYNTVPCYVWPMPVSNLIPSAAAIAPAMAETGARIGNCRLRAVGGRVLFAEIRVHRQHVQPWIQFAQSFLWRIPHVACRSNRASSGFVD